MQEAVLMSPVAFAQAGRKSVNGPVNGMETALSFAAADVEATRSETLSICDVSNLSRFGVKGPQAQAWLQSAGVTLPEGTNTWAPQDNGSLVMRLGNSEFLVEDKPGNELSKTLNDTAVNESGVHKVIRNDAAFIVSGKLTSALFSEVCEIDLDGSALEDNHLVMTVIAGVSVTMLKQEVNGQSVYRIWCDGTFGSYLWKTLLTIIEEQGGGPVGFNFYYEIN